MVIYLRMFTSAEEYYSSYNFQLIETLKANLLKLSKGHSNCVLLVKLHLKECSKAVRSKVNYTNCGDSAEV